jgi:hypothetical protein
MNNLGQDECLVIKVDTNEWQIGFAGEDAPRVREEHGWGSPLSKAATSLVEVRYDLHCACEVA